MSGARLENRLGTALVSAAIVCGCALERRPLAWFAILFAAGCALAQACAVGRAGLLPLYASVALAAVLAMWARRRMPRLCLLLLAGAFGLGGYAGAALRSQVHGVPPLDGEALLEGRVAGPVNTRCDRSRFLFEADRVITDRGERQAHFSVHASGPPMPLFQGDRLRLRAKLSPVSPPMNPGAQDVRRRFAAEGSVGYASVVEAQVAKLGETPWLERHFEGRRAAFRSLLDKTIVSDEPRAPAAGKTPDSVGPLASDEARALVAALAIGDRAQLSDETNEAFSATGLAHILSVSGLHVAVVAAGLYAGLRRLLSRSTILLTRCDPRALAAVIALPVVAYYVLLTGAEPPAVRSGLMAGVALSATAFRREPDTFTSLGAALLVALLYDPASLQALSFQLSFAAVAGLILLSAPIRRLVPVARPKPRNTRYTTDKKHIAWSKRVGSLFRTAFEHGRESVLSTASATLAASVATAPLVAEAFHRASYVALAANLIGFPVASALTVLAASAALLQPLSEPVAKLMLLAAEPCAWLLMETGRRLAALPFSNGVVASLPLVALTGWYGLCAVFGAARPPRRAVGLVALVSTLGLVGTMAHRELGPEVSDALTVTFFSVGQGDAALAQLPYGGAILIDAGGVATPCFDPGERILLPALAELQATRLDALLLSHPHPDHLAGADAVLNRLKVGELWHAPQAVDEALFEDLARRARERGTALRRLSRGERITTPTGVTIDVLGPPADAPLVENDASLVVRIAYGDHSFLFLGDVEAEGEEALAQAGDLRATVVKAPHHGSRTSSSRELVEAVRPEQVVFSVGRDNRYGFPHREVVDRWRSVGARTWRTDQTGAIRFKTDGKRLEVTPFVLDSLAADGEEVEIGAREDTS